MKLWKFFKRLQKKELFAALDNHISEAERISHKMDHYKVALDGEVGWFERECQMRFNAPKKGSENGACPITLPCNSNT
jgi:hypothetical protein